MVNQKAVALALVLMVSDASADNCKTQSKGIWKLKTSLTGVTCLTKTMTLENCATCCELLPGTCYAVGSSGTSCPETHYFDQSKTGNTATTANFIANCCTKKKTCDYDCVAVGRKNKPDYATIKCTTEKCSRSKCCDIDGTKCVGVMASCKDGYYSDSSKDTVGATKDNYNDKCCTAQKTCDITCPASEKKKADYATVKCKYEKCRESECCEDNPNACKLLASNTNKCDVTEVSTPDVILGSMDAATIKAAGLTGDNKEYRSKCCVKKSTCEAFAAAKLEVSGAVKQQAFATAILLSMGGYLSMGK